MKMMGLALDGVTSLSIKPIRLVMALGVVISVASFFRHRVGGGECCDGVGCIRLGEYDQRDMPFGRRPAHMPRCHRGICRQDLSRDQGTPALHHLRAHELRR